MTGCCAHFKLKPLHHTCIATAYSIYCHISLLLIKQNQFFFLLYFDVHLTESNPLPLLAHYPSIPAASRWSLCCHSNRNNPANSCHGFSTTGPRWHPGLLPVTCWPSIYPVVSYATKTENKDSGRMFSNTVCALGCIRCVCIMCMSQTQHGARLHWAPDQSANKKCPQLGMKLRAVRLRCGGWWRPLLLSPASCCLKECAIMGERATLAD